MSAPAPFMNASAQRAMAASVAIVLALAPLGAEERVDLDAVHRIREEAFQNSKVMEHMFYLTDVYGPRLTNSPGFFDAANWAVKQLGEWGVQAHLEKWGPYGQGWTYTKFSAAMIEPQYAPLIGVPLAYASPTNGPVRGEVVIANLNNDADLNNNKGKLKGKIVLIGPGRDLPMSLQPLATRRTEQNLSELARAADPNPPAGARPPGTEALAPPGGRGGRGGGQNGAPGNGTPQQQFNRRLNQFLKDEGVLVGVRLGGQRSEGGTVFAQAAGSRDPKDPVPPPMVALTPEHYNRIARLLDHKMKVVLEFDIESRFLTDSTDSVNVIGEIPGSSKPDEIVMIGAHLDSWHGGTGATDNAAGSAVMLEVMRILKSLNLPLARTVRIGLWGGEEQGILGSRAYVAEHFAAREDMKLKPEHAKLSGYFNVDNGSGRIRGVYLQGNDMMRPVFEEWFKPFQDLGAGTISIRNTTGTDHLSFDAVGLPGFQFIQDELEYNSRTHHSNMDVYDRIQRSDMMQMAAIVASFVYNAANRDGLLPRKPLPKPQPPRQPANNGAAGGN
jgi:carboxypeptidase Q